MNMSRFEYLFHEMLWRRNALEEFLHEGEALFRAGRINEAIRHYQELVNSCPEEEPFLPIFVTAAIKLGLAYASKNDYWGAAESFNKIPLSVELKAAPVPKEIVQRLLLKGDESLALMDYARSANYYRAVRNISHIAEMRLKAELGIAETVFLSQGNLAGVVPLVLRYDINTCQELISEKCRIWLKRGKEKKSKKNYDKALSYLNFARKFCAENRMERHELFFKINKCMAKIYFQVNKTKLALSTFRDCMRFDAGYFVGFWKSQFSKAKQEETKEPDSSISRLKMLSFFASSMPKSAALVPSMRDVHLKLHKIDLDAESFKAALSRLAVAREYMTEHGFHDQELSEGLKELGDTLQKVAMLEDAKTAYTFALDVIPKESFHVKRGLLYNRSSINEKLGSFKEAVRDAEACTQLYSSWPEGYHRLAEAFRCQKNFFQAHNALIKCYGLSDSLGKPDIILKIILNIMSTDSEDQTRKMKLPQQPTADEVNKVVSLLMKNGSKHATDGLCYLFLQTEYATHIRADSLKVSRFLKDRCPTDFSIDLINKGANLEGALDAILELENRSHKENEMVVLLVQKGTDLSKYVDIEPEEPYQFIVVRLCIQLDKLDILSDVVKTMNFDVVSKNCDTVLHLLAKVSYSNIVLRCLKLIIKRKSIDPKVKNKDGLTASELIAQDTDERKKLLDDLAATGSYQCGKKKKKKKKTNDQNNDAGKDGDNVDNAGLADAKSDEKKADNFPGKESENQKSEHYEKTKKKKEGVDVITTFDTARKEAQERIRKFEIEVWQNEDSTSKAKDGPSERTQKSEAEAVKLEEAAVDTDHGIASPLVPEENADGEDQDAYADDDFQELSEFEGLPWEVQCTSEFWKKLKDQKLEDFLKRKILSKVKLLASGDWRRDSAIKLEGPWCSTGIRLYKAKVTKGARMIWEEAIAFSERCSNEETSEGHKNAVYSDIIRLWDFTLNHDSVPNMIDRVVKSRMRGQTCMVKKKLKAMEVKMGTAKGNDLRLPQLYTSRSTDDGQALRAESQKGSLQLDKIFFPSASPNDSEFHILKFYNLSDAMAKTVLQHSEENFDFPFQVSELEFQIIRLKPAPLSSILLIGRSGTGKTTCCLYRLWSKFKVYWETAVTAGPYIPVLQRFLKADSSDSESIEDENDGDNTLTKIPQEEKAMSCGCKGACYCAIAFARANNAHSSIEENATIPKELLCNEKPPQSIDQPDVIYVNGDKEHSESSEVTDKEKEYRHLRQMFITKNKVLCHEVSKNFKDLCNGLPFAKDHVSYIGDTVIESLNSVNELSFPLFLGARDLWLALDATLAGRPFFPRDTNGKLFVPVAGWGEKENHLAFLPGFDSEDEDEEIEEEEDDETVVEKKPERTKKKNAVSVKREVTYTMFVNEIWPEIERKKKSGYHPSLVWTEVCSFIKGTAESLVSKNGYMSKEEYHKIGRKKAPNFTGNRDIIYDMFEMYHQMCVDKNLFDEFDLLFNVHRRLSKDPIQPWLLDEIYVDETQDFKEAELFTLIRCCQNPNQLFFTGDTAQSIMRGITFRFKDLRSLFLEAQKCLKSYEKSPIQVPDKVYQLTYNYRSHKGILDLASSIVNLLGYFFPDSFDRLADDVGLFDGPKPVILETTDFGDLALMLRGIRRKTSPIEFGAHQVVLVSTEESKETLPEELSYALVLTIYEAKGLEFDDVLLYNFFKDSQARKEWRVVNSYLEHVTSENKSEETGCQGKDEGLHVSDLSFDSRPLEFEYNKHKILNSELKQLYTALTRARVNVWIYDEDTENRAPMFNYFKRMGLVDIIKLDEEAADSVTHNGMFAVKSSIADWEERGHYFYKKGLWNVAYKCFLKTQNESMLTKCTAYILAMKAHEMGMQWKTRRSGTLKAVFTEYLKAASIYLDCGLGDEAVICLRNAKEWKLLGDLCFRLKRYQEAGKYYAKATGSGSKDNVAIKASECYEKAGLYRFATDILYQNEKYQECIELMKRYAVVKHHSAGSFVQQPRSTLNVEKIIKEALDHSQKQGDIVSLKAFLRYLPIEKRLEYLSRKHGCEDVYLEVLVEVGRSEEAADIYIQKGLFMKAVNCTQLDAKKGICFLQEARHLWQRSLSLPKGNEDSPGLDSRIKEALEKALHFIPNGDELNRADCYFFYGLISADYEEYMQRAVDAYVKCHNHIGVLLCHKFLLERGCMTTDVIVESLAKMLHQLGNINSSRSAETFKLIQQFFGIEKLARHDRSFSFRVNKSKLLFRLSTLRASRKYGEDASSFFQQMDERNGNLCLVSALFSLAEGVVANLLSVYKSELDKTMLCTNFLEGIEHKECRLQHVIPNAEIAQPRLNAIFVLIQIQGVVRQKISVIVKNERLQDELRKFPNLRKYNEEKEMVHTCHLLYRELTSFIRYLDASRFPGLQLAKALPQMQFVKEQIQWCIQKIWTDDNKYIDVDVFLEVFSLANFAGLRYLKDEVDAIREDIKQRYRENLPRNELGMYNTRYFVYETFHTLFIDGRQWLHSDGDLIKSMHYLLRRALPMALSKKILPSFRNLMDMLEHCLSLCLISLSRTVPGTFISIPSYYIEGIQFWSGIYQYCNNLPYSAVDSVEYVRWRSGTSYACRLVECIIDIMISNQKKQKLDFFANAFNNDNTSTVDSVRFLILTLVLLANHDLISKENKDIGHPVIEKLRKHAFNLQTSESRLHRALKRAAMIKSPKTAIDVLRQTVEESSSTLLHHNWDQLRYNYKQTNDVAPEPLIGSTDNMDEKPRAILKKPAEEKPAIDAANQNVFQNFQEKAPDVSEEEKPPVRSIKNFARFVEKKLMAAEKRSNIEERSTSASVASPSDAHNAQKESSKDEKSVQIESEGELQQPRILQREISSEDEAFEMRDLAAKLKANEEIRRREHHAASTIQQWWKRVKDKVQREAGLLGGSEDDRKFEDHRSKYIEDLKCSPCGKSLESKDLLRLHILRDDGHAQKVVAYDQYSAYKKSFVNRWLGDAEDLMDKDFRGQPISSNKGISQTISKCIDKVTFEINYIETSRRWTDLGGIKDNVTALQGACNKLKEQIRHIEGEAEDAEDDVDDTVDDFTVVTYRKNRKSNNLKRPGKGGKKGR